MPDPLNELREQFTRRLVDRTFGIWTEPTVADSIWAKVAPLIRAALADAWDEGWEAGHEDARAVQATYPQSTPNPYRGQRAILAEMANDAQKDGATAP